MLRVITPVKDSIQSTIQTLSALATSNLQVPHQFIVYNDFSTPENTELLTAETTRLGIQLIHLSDLTLHPSPNYLLVLQREQQICLEENADLIIVESDVTVQPDTLQKLADTAHGHPNCGIAAAVTVDEQGQINYPYLFARGKANRTLNTRKHLSFCCSLLTNNLLHAFPFSELDESRNWYDVTISHESLRLGFENLLLTSLPVTHRPHQSRPWKQLKYTNPVKYYWLKFTRGLDKI